MQVKASVGGDFDVSLSVNETRALRKAHGVVQMLKRADGVGHMGTQLTETEELLENLISTYGAKAAKDVAHT